MYSNYEEKRGRRREGREGERVYSVYEGREGEERERESLTCKELSKGTIEQLILSHSLTLNLTNHLHMYMYNTCTCIPSQLHSLPHYLSIYPDLNLNYFKPVWLFSPPSYSHVHTPALLGFLIIFTLVVSLPLVREQAVIRFRVFPSTFTCTNECNECKAELFDHRVLTSVVHAHV